MLGHLLALLPYIKIFLLVPVEKAALVFSLKLDNGHKLLCPWIDNTCDETLAQFPPTTPQVLADQFRKRSSSLAHLLALPVISSSAIEFMRTPQLDQFLQQSSLLECDDVLPEIPSVEYHENGSDKQTADLYYQVLIFFSTTDKICNVFNCYMCEVPDILHTISDLPNGLRSCFI